MLQVQLTMFRNTTNARDLHSAKLAYRKMSKELRAIFPCVFNLLKILLVCPVSSAECERSFSALRRLKTWLRSTMSQKRLNYAVVCNVHKHLLDDVDINIIVNEFISRSEIRKKRFGNCI